MSAERTAGLLLRLYPRAWRDRYGEELEALILETSGRRVAWRVRADIALAAIRERLRRAGLAGDSPPAERVRGGVLLVLCAWALFVVAGAAVQKLSEHWQAATPSGSRALAAGAFDALLAAAGIGSAFVLAGVAVALPSLVRFLRSDGTRAVRTHLRVAAGLTLAAVPAAAGIVVWASRLTPAQRNGHDWGYAVAAGVWALLLVACLAAWTVAGVAIARRLDLSPAVLRLEPLLATGVAVAMAVMTAATVVWWAALARSGSAVAAIAPELLTATTLMLLATVAAAAGAGRSLRAPAAGTIG